MRRAKAQKKSQPAAQRLPGHYFRRQRIFTSLCADLLWMPGDPDNTDDDEIQKKGCGPPAATIRISKYRANYSPGPRIQVRNVSAAEKVQHLWAVAQAVVQQRSPR
jgi:hypothetical protein